MTTLTFVVLTRDTSNVRPLNVFSFSIASIDNLQHRAVRHTYNGQTKPFKFVVVQKNNQKAFSVNDHFLYSPDLNV